MDALLLTVRFFLVLAALLPRREDLLAATGPQLRSIMLEVLSPADMATRLVEEEPRGEVEGETAGRGARKSTLISWCEEAEALDLSTPESFRHHLALIGEVAEAEHEVR